jgi:rhamnosyltransferase
VNRPKTTVIVRTRDAEDTIGGCLKLLAGQNVEPETIVVDSGSRDQTRSIAAGLGARVIELPASEFTFGRALNVGAAAASGELLAAVSADAFVPDPGWLGRLSAWFADEQVACASGDRWSYDASPLRRPVRQDAALAQRFPRWGYSNAAGGFRASLWRRRPFREDLPGCEDQEWARYWLGEGRVCVIDPGLVVDHDHTHDPLARIYRRARREAEGFAMFLGDGVESGLLKEWWADDPYYASRARALLSHRRAARLLGTSAGRRRARRRR